MTNEYRNTYKDELLSMLAICVAIIVPLFVYVLGVAILTTLFPFRTVENMPSGICNTSASCVTVPKLQKRIQREPKANESSIRLMASLNPKDGFLAKSLSPSRDDGLGMILIWMEYQRGFDGLNRVRNEFP
jgi:hypothetical protein